MKQKSLVFTLIFALFLSIPFSNAQKTKTKKGKAKSKKALTTQKVKKAVETVTQAVDYPYESVENDPLNARIYTLKNGLKVYLSVNKDEPRIQTLIPIRVGCKQDPRETTGLAHYLEHMLFKGTSEMGTLDWDAEKVLLDKISDLYEEHLNTTDPDKKLALYQQIDSVSFEASKFASANEYDKLTSSLGAKGTNAYTSTDETVYMNEIPSNELEKWLQIESERFSELVLRLFHTELETVYEEFNMSQDRDGSKVYQSMLTNIFPNHPYNISTIGIGEHLKNPSMKSIHKFFDTYYVANNMAVCLSGDLDPDETIKLVDKYFGQLEPGEVPEWTFTKEKPIEKPIHKEVVGPEAAYANLYYRFDGAGSDDAIYLKLLDGILQNGQAGLIDLNLLQKQKVLDGRAYQYNMNDYSLHVIQGKPKEGQSLEEVKDLLLAQIEEIKKGNFDDWLIDAVIKDFKLNEIKSYEENRSRAFKMANAFVEFRDWKDVVKDMERMEKITKADIQKFTQENYKDNYVSIFKQQGEDSTALKLEKPALTPIELARDRFSDFSEKVNKAESKSLQPKFLDFNAEIKKMPLNSGVELNYIKNETNQLFDLYYIFDMGTDHNKEMGLAIKYLPFLGTEEYTSEELKKEFYKLGLNFDVFSSDSRMYITLSGLDESFEEGVKLFEHILANVKPDEKALDELIARELKGREDAKASQNIIFWRALYSYGTYGAKSPFTNVLSTEELQSVKAKELVDLIKQLSNYEHYVFYYGSQDIDPVNKSLDKHHQTPKVRKPYPEPVVYEQVETDKNKVYFVNHDMVQAKIIMLKKSEQFNAELLPYADMYGEYFGSGLSAIVFQEIREKRGLAYSVFSGFSSPTRTDRAHYMRSYMAVQGDKMKDALEAMTELLNNMPEIENQFDGAKNAIMKKLESERVTKDQKYFSYLQNKDRGLDYDTRKDVYEMAQTITLQEMKDFFQDYIKSDKYTYLVIGNKETLDMELLNSLGEFEELTLEQLFNY